MKDEQIKQNAEEYANKKAQEVANFQRKPVVEDFIAGAHSRDEKIEELQRQVAELTERNFVLKDTLARGDQLRNPWISVEDRLPKKDGEYVLVYLPKHNEVFQAFLCDNEWIGAPTGEEVTHWMPIPKLNK